MCNYTQREFACGHFRWLASKHCSEYKTKRGSRSMCAPEITAFEDRTFVCGECRLKQEPPTLPEWFVSGSGRRGSGASQSK